MSRIITIINKYPMIRGMISYSIIWPTSALIQQKIAGKTWGLYLTFNNSKPCNLCLSDRLILNFIYRHL